MREIKFRAWDKKASRFLDENDNTPNFLNVVPCDTTGEFTPMFMTIEQSSTYDVDLDVQFFTGLNDKNGAEIYEGDIVIYRLYSEKIAGDVRWDEKQATFVKRAEKVQGEWQYKPLASYIATTEVIGNIYENPELLE